MNTILFWHWPKIHSGGAFAVQHSGGLHNSVVWQQKHIRKSTKKCWSIWHSSRTHERFWHCPMENWFVFAKPSHVTFELIQLDCAAVFWKHWIVSNVENVLIKKKSNNVLEQIQKKLFPEVLQTKSHWQMTVSVMEEQHQLATHNWWRNNPWGASNLWEVNCHHQWLVIAKCNIFSMKHLLGSLFGVWWMILQTMVHFCSPLHHTTFGSMLITL